MVLLLIKKRGLTRSGGKFGARGHRYRRTRRKWDKGDKRIGVDICFTIMPFPAITNKE